TWIDQLPGRGHHPLPSITPPLPRLRARALGTPLGFRLRRRTGSRLVIDGLGRISLDRLRHLVVFRHALLEGLYPLREIAHQIGQFAAAAEQKHHHDDDDHPVPYAQRTHWRTLRGGGAVCPPRL